MIFTENDLKQAEEFNAFIEKVFMKVLHKHSIKVDHEEWGKISRFTFPEEHQMRPHLDAIKTINKEDL